MQFFIVAVSFFNRIFVCLLIFISSRIVRFSHLIGNVRFHRLFHDRFRLLRQLSF